MTQENSTALASPAEMARDIEEISQTLDAMQHLVSRLKRQLDQHNRQTCLAQPAQTDQVSGEHHKIRHPTRRRWPRQLRRTLH